MIQDGQGFLWLGTDNGLNRFDGHTFTVFKNDPTDPRSLSYNSVWSLCEDQEGALWIGTFSGGLNRFDPQTGRFTRFQHQAAEPGSLSNNYVNVVYEDRQGTLWAGTGDLMYKETPQGGLNRFNPDTSTFTRFHHDAADTASLSHEYITTLYEDRAGIFWVGTFDGLNRMDRITGTFERFLPGQTIMAMYEDGTGMLWVGTYQGLWQVERSRGAVQFKAYDIGVAPITDIQEDYRGRLWIGTVEGLLYLDPARKQLVRYRPDPQNPGSLSHPKIVDLYEDRSGTLWVAAGEGGSHPWSPLAGGALNKVQPLPDAFTVLHQGKPNGADAAAFHVRSILEDESGRLWVGTFGGPLHQYDKERNYIQALPFPEAFALHASEAGNIWIGSFSGELTHFMPDTETAKDSYRGDPILDIYEDRSGNVWIGGFRDGLRRYDLTSGTVKSYTNDPWKPLSLSGNRVNVIHEAHSKGLWIATNQGLNHFDPSTEIFTRYQHDPEHPGSLSSDHVLSLYEDASGVLWVGTDRGLNRLERSHEDELHPDQDTFKLYTAQNSGLPGNFVLGIYEDSDGHLWMSTESGIARFDPSTETVRTFGVVEGLPIEEFALNAHFQSRTGELFFGGPGGLIAFFPDQIADNPFPPEIAFTGLRLFNQPVAPGPDSPLKRPIGSTEILTLGAEQNDLTIDYVGLHFQNPKQIQYAYMLEGYDEQWRQVGTQRSATYTKLEPGSYVFRVKAANSDGLWNEEKALRITVAPPWWRRAWFYALCLLGLLSLAYAGYRVRVHQLRVQARALQEQVAERTRELVAEKQKTEAQANRLKELDEAKSRFFANISHEFRTPLTLIIAPVRDALARPDAPALSRAQLQLIHRSSLRLLRLVKQLFDLSKLEASRMRLNRQPGDLGGFVRGLIRSFAPLAERRRITLQYRLEAEVRRFAFDPEALEKVFSNLLSNALKFTPEGGKVWVTVHTRNETGEEVVEVVVKDTGPGIAGAALERIFDRFEQVDGSATRAHEGMGLGLALARELVELHGGTLRVESELGFGSAFIVWLPLGVYPEAPMSKEAPVPETGTMGDGAAELEAAALLLDVDGKRADAEPTSASDKPVVLVVEDNRDVRQLLRDYLGADYLVLEAADGEAGLEAAQQHRPDLVIADVMMPRMDGYALCRALKADEALRTIPVMLLTAKVSEEDRLYGLEGGAADYLSKPFSRRELEVRVANLILSRRELRRQFSREIQVKPFEVVIQPEDEVFLEQVLDVLEAHLSDSTFTTDRLADALGLSRRQAERRVKDVTGETPPALLRRLRLERAAQLLKARPGSISEVAYAVGFKSPSHFARVFRERYGVAPSEHIENTT